MVLKPRAPVLRFMARWATEDTDKGRFIELFQRCYDRKAADEFRNEAVTNEIFRLDVVQQFADLQLLFLRLDVGNESDTTLGGPVLDYLLQACEGAAADEKDIAGINLQKLLLRVLAAALRRYRGDRPFNKLQQRLLDALSGYITGD